MFFFLIILDFFIPLCLKFYFLSPSFSVCVCHAARFRSAVRSRKPETFENVFPSTSEIKMFFSPWQSKRISRFPRRPARHGYNVFHPRTIRGGNVREIIFISIFPKRVYTEKKNQNEHFQNITPAKS